MLTGDNPQPKRDTSPEKSYSLPEARWDNIQPSSSGPLGWSPHRPHGAPSVKPRSGLLPSLTPSCPHLGCLGSPLRHTACTMLWGRRCVWRNPEPELPAGFQHVPSLSVAWFASSSGGSRDSRGLSFPKETVASSHDSCSSTSTFRKKIFFSLSLLSQAWLFPVCFLCEEHVLKLNRVGPGP